MIIATASTIRDNLPNVQRFVQGNLRGGVDHLFVFLDAPAPEVEEWLATQPTVTAILTDESWWQGSRAPLLNRRQKLNANLVKSVLAYTGGVDWLFHIDADEVAQIDRSTLEALPSTTKAARLRPLEVVSKMHWDGPPTLFKRLLKDPELNLLFTLGLLVEPTNSLYFRSHIVGKAGMRPNLDLWHDIHQIRTRKGELVPPAHAKGLEHLHYESYSGEDFVRKWRAMIGSGPKVHFGEHRMKLATGMKALLEKDLPEEVVSGYLTEIYHRHMEDAVDTLQALQLLKQIDPLQREPHTSTLTEATRAGFTEHVEACRAVDKQSFRGDASSARQINRLLGNTLGRRARA